MKYPQKSISYKFSNIIITIPTLVISVIIGALYNKVVNYISILGGFCGVIISFIIPGNILLIYRFVLSKIKR